MFVVQTPLKTFNGIFQLQLFPAFILAYIKNDSQHPFKVKRENLQTAVYAKFQISKKF